ncbi:DNA protecting protein DprA [Francisella halioticida]|uniref:DNA-protecting protein DprA n=1 Tax=Francisella halioticida TaxID=549298 RepID=A0ABM6M1H3_9GAMM|nr:DNA-processing protein DprA [Francisella halioticida]ASG68687.1 DNA-protecting protein DprA [Francisella halioticida]BCD91622.1 DNA protecting protein DprA [Francisella halioticida]
MQDNTKNLIILSHTPYFGTSRFLKALSEGFCFEEIIKQPSKYLKSLSLHQETIDFLNAKKYNKYLEKVNKWLAHPKNQILTFLDSNYSENLKQLASPPTVIYGIGNIELIKKSQLAIVGARNHSAYGRNVTKKLCSDLQNSQISITSGLAYGIDTLAHKFAIENNLNTIAVVGTGVDVIYPSSNRELYNKLIETNNLIISEFALGTDPLRHNFPQRNRIISGLAKGVVIVEAAKKSSSLITAQLALDQNKEVFAIPGNIFSKTSEGCNELIKQGAKFVSDINDIFQEINIFQNNTQSSTRLNNQERINLSNSEKNIFDIINKELTTLDDIIIKSKLPYNQVTTILFELELKSLIEPIPGGYINTQ